MKNKWLVFMLCVSLVLFASSVYNYNNYRAAKAEVEATYERAFSDLSDCVTNIDLNLTKLMVTKDPKQIGDLSVDLWREASLAKNNLGMLPTSSLQLDNLENYLSQVGNYTYTLSKNINDGNTPTVKEINQLKGLIGYSDSLNNSLKEAETNILNSSFAFTKENGKVFASDTVYFPDQIGEIEKTFSDYVSLVYDGPFSQHLLNKKPAMIKEKTEITKEDAKYIAEHFIEKDNVKSVEVIGESEGNMPCYECRAIFENDDDREAMIEVTKNGGYVRMMLDSRSIKDNKITTEKAEQLASEFLKNNGYYRMKQTGFVRNGNSLEIAFAYNMSDYVLYTDQIKVKVALDNGEVIGYEASSYLTNHNPELKLPSEVISEEEARQKVSKNIEIKNVQKCLIPLKTGKNVFCYEYNGTYNNREFLIYINITDGNEENILLVDESNGSRLTL